jgi:hypothetical protein
MNEDNQKKNFQINELVLNNTYYDITGNMNIWRVHETYAGTGNDSVWDEILSEKNLKKENVTTSGK